MRSKPVHENGFLVVRRCGMLTVNSKKVVKISDLHDEYIEMPDEIVRTNVTITFENGARFTFNILTDVPDEFHGKKVKHTKSFKVHIDSPGHKVTIHKLEVEGLSHVTSEQKSRITLHDVAKYA